MYSVVTECQLLRNTYQKRNTLVNKMKIFVYVNLTILLISYYGLIETSENATGNNGSQKINLPQGGSIYLSADGAQVTAHGITCDNIRIVSDSTGTRVTIKDQLNSTAQTFTVPRIPAPSHNPKQPKKIQTPVEHFIRHLPLGAMLLFEDEIPGGNSDYFIARTAHSFATSTARKLALLIRTPANGTCQAVDATTRPTPLHTQMKGDVIKKILKNPTAEIAAVAIDAVVDRIEGEYKRYFGYQKTNESTATQGTTEIQGIAINILKLARMVIINTITHKLLPAAV